ncbi:hypothetical protein Leryth_021483 [Lithospermum erythrorhizon]|nr:hypothetical protein Leryth_021483 [Lithospermum erythrorhizon]
MDVSEREIVSARLIALVISTDKTMVRDGRYRIGVPAFANNQVDKDHQGSFSVQIMQWKLSKAPEIILLKSVYSSTEYEIQL